MFYKTKEVNLRALINSKLNTYQSIEDAFLDVYSSIQKPIDDIDYKTHSSTSKYVESGLSVLGVKLNIINSDFIFKCCKCKHKMVYTEYEGRKNISFRIKDDLSVEYTRCNYCNTKNFKKWKKNNPKKFNRNCKKYIKNNKHKIRLMHRKYSKKRYHTDPLFRLSVISRTAICGAFRNNGYTKKSKTYEILGCSFKHLYKYIENQFVDGMSWDNRTDWHIDHIIPVCSANTKEELIKLLHHTNLQPLWAKENISKGGSYNEEDKITYLESL